ncbi:MAG TPA: hypothetical protein VE344_07125 [Methylomirabilota bacterium]|nr:hypothetical protein [Methylomirabilota bacterium]
MKPTLLIILCGSVLLMAGCNKPEKHVSLADLHPTSPGSATYDPTNDWTTISMAGGGGTMRMLGNYTNVTFYPPNTPHPVPAGIFQRLYQQGNPQTAVATEYLGQKDGYAYLRIISIPIAHPKKKSEQIVYVKLSELDQSFEDALPPNTIEKK